MRTYSIVRFFADPKQHREVVATGVTLQEAQKHCKDPDSSSKTCTTGEGLRRTTQRGPWFDGWTEDS